MGFPRYRLEREEEGKRERKGEREKVGDSGKERMRGIADEINRGVRKERERGDIY